MNEHWLLETGSCSNEPVKLQRFGRWHGVVLQLFYGCISRGKFFIYIVFFFFICTPSRVWFIILFLLVWPRNDGWLCCTYFYFFFIHILLYYTLFFLILLFNSIPICVRFSFYLVLSTRLILSSSIAFLNHPSVPPLAIAVKL